MGHTRLAGMSASAGLGIGPPIVLLTLQPADDAPVHMTVAEAARRTAERFEELAARAEAAGRTDERDILEAYAMLAEDPSLLEAIGRHEESGQPVVGAVRTAVAALEQTFRDMADDYLAQRGDDIAGVGRELVATLTGAASGRTDLPEGAIVCAVDLTPADTIHLDLARIGGLATERGGPTSHTAIVARAAGIPAVVGIAGLTTQAAGAELALIDGHRGEVVLDPSAATLAEAETRIAKADARAREYERLRGQHVHFADERVLVAANVGAPHDLEAAIEAQADGVGLFRSELLFLERDHAPDMAEQRAAYARAVEAFEDPTVVRTLDIGGDKDVPYLDLEPEDNPFLGVRGLRLCLAAPELFAQQLDALVAASMDGRLRVMFPMVASTADLDAALQLLAARAQAAGTAPPAAGIMIETPAAALLAPHLATRCSFFSIGTNDLTQYTVAADRGLSSLGGYQDPAQPAVLQLIDLSCRAAAEAGIPVAVCGEAGSDPAAAALLLGLGVRELSVAPGLVDRTRWLVSQLDPQATREAAQAALRAPDADAVREIADGVLP